MAAKTLKASPEGVNRINLAMAENDWSRDALAERCHCSRQPAVNFCAGKKRVRRDLFIQFCKALGLPWLEIVDDTVPEPKKDTNTVDIDALVQDVRAKVKDDIQYRCGIMRVLDMEQAIGVDDIYTSVNILERLTGRRRLEISELLGDCGPEAFDRFMLGKVEQERVPGLEAVERYARLMILGKPGAGKTTFMKRLATLCNRWTFQSNRVPIFVTLKEFAEAQGRPGVYDYIAGQWRGCRVQDADALTTILYAGRALILLDGLDEVREEDHDRVLQNIKDFTREFQDCQFVMTCRIAAREYTFEQFTEVEVADFDDEQIADFVTKWFKTKDDPKKGGRFVDRIKDDKPIKELATNPLLLTLLCLVFGEAGDFPGNRAELYKEGLDVLLKKWDSKRNIERYQAYKKLSLKRKEDLLSELAYQTFDRGEYFFKQQVIEQKIIDYIQNLPGANEEEEALQLDSEAVLKSISSQHGLLVARASGIYSFSHLTFQEYFTARQITRPSTKLLQALQRLTTHVADKRYREVFLLAIGMLPEADDLLLAMQQQTNQMVAADADIQKLLTWVEEKSQSVGAIYKAAAVRAFYFSCYLDLDLNHNLDLDLNLDLALDHNLVLDRNLDLNLAFDRYLYLSIDFALDLNRNRYLDLAVDCCLALGGDTSSNTELKLRLESLRNCLPAGEKGEAVITWWREQVTQWLKDMRSVMIEHRNIGHDWPLAEKQKYKLQQYYEANSLIADCLNSDCYITKATRQAIEKTLLLPISSI